MVPRPSRVGEDQVAVGRLDLDHDPGELGDGGGGGTPGDLGREVAEAVGGIGLRQDGETFLQAYRRVGAAPFKEAVYAAH